MLLAATFGLYGVMFGWLIILMHLLHLRSFGFPYLEPLAPLKHQNCGMYWCGRRVCR